jgi:hypothetical protein
MLPADTLWSWIGNAPPSALLELVRRFDQGGEFEKGLAMANAATGVNLERDVIGRIGPMVGAFASRGTGGGSGPMGLVAFAQCDDPSRVMATLERLVARFAKDNGAKVETKKWKHGDDVCLSFLMPGTPLPLEPTFATTGDVLYVAVSRGAIKEALDQRALRERRTSILDHPRLKELPTGALQGLIAFGFNDTPEALERGYGTLTMLQSSLGSMIQGAGLPAGAQAFVPDLSELLPTFTAMARGARPSLSLTYVHGEDLLAATTHDSSFLARMTATLGSPGGQIQPMMVPMVAAVAIPRLMASRLKANEAAAISTLRSIASAQAQLQHSGAIDVDVDGGGEYGLFGDLAGSRNLRGTDAPLAPAVLSPAFGELQPDDCGGAVIRRSGYIFQMWLPGKWVPGATTGVTDSPVAGPAEGVDADASEVLWRCYAWPEKAGQTGQRAFFLDQEGDLYFLANTRDVTRRPYEGTCADGGRQPTFDAISETAGDFDSHPPATGGLSSDGELWQRLL